MPSISFFGFLRAFSQCQQVTSFSNLHGPLLARYVTSDYKYASVKLISAIAGLHPVVHFCFTPRRRRASYRLSVVPRQLICASANFVRFAYSSRIGRGSCDARMKAAFRLSCRAPRERYNTYVGLVRLSKDLCIGLCISLGLERSHYTLPDYAFVCVSFVCLALAIVPVCPAPGRNATCHPRSSFSSLLVDPLQSSSEKSSCSSKTRRNV